MTRAVRAVLALALALTAVTAAGVPASATPTSTWTPLTYQQAPADNPLKGFMPYAGSYQTFPHSMEWFYLPLRDLMTGPATFDWVPLERRLNAIARRGHHAVFRVYLDYPAKPTGIPQFLLDQGLATHSYPDHGNNGLSVSPDYEDPRLVAALDRFIGALGRRYDGDPRIGFIQVGLVGFWGEWHTWPYDGGTRPENWMASEATQAVVLNRFESAFKRTRLLVRYPSALNKDLHMGYHDDSMAFETLPPTPWHFVQRLIDNGVTEKWRAEPIGGELRPEVQSCIFDAPVSCAQYEDYDESVTRSHASFLLNQAPFEGGGFTGDEWFRAVAGARSLGYELTVTEAALPAAPARGNATVGVRIANRGLAPFYYDWKAELAAVDSAGRVAKRWTVPWTITGIQPGAAPAEMTAQLKLAGLGKGEYDLTLRVVNPLPGGNDLRFANAAQDVHSGLLTLGRLTVG
ncbi:hypothetical protein HNP84_007521 [Thermocatellispora tengchongensis]|uniref:DUF4832 domain-containing protein n=1 Tax=Thermocatellispora tengchongensis TaxID=1073253 RepID=A0A840PDT0_9ACTN|nr:DUF4832 domain-containing protein [Thermocatellispora tengchongensis]MBB5137768.1 hypothetical protein [Thermocatellispora tengchongensis]